MGSLLLPVLERERHRRPGHCWEKRHGNLAAKKSIFFWQVFDRSLVWENITNIEFHFRFYKIKSVLTVELLLAFKFLDL
jgi:hypothetical protein